MGCTGLAENRLEFLKERGAIVEKQENEDDAERDER